MPEEDHFYLFSFDLISFVQKTGMTYRISACREPEREEVGYRDFVNRNEFIAALRKLGLHEFIAIALDEIDLNQSHIIQNVSIRETSARELGFF